MNLKETIEDLRIELRTIDQAIAAFERLYSLKKRSRHGFSGPITVKRQSGGGQTTVFGVARNPAVPVNTES